MKNLSYYAEIKAHNYKYTGVSCVAFSSNSNLIYSGGNDGSLFIWELVPSEFIVKNIEFF
jgi:WD40 repeat protein